MKFLNANLKYILIALILICIKEGNASIYLDSISNYSECLSASNMKNTFNIIKKMINEEGKIRIYTIGKYQCITNIQYTNSSLILSYFGKTNNNIIREYISVQDNSKGNRIQYYFLRYNEKYTLEDIKDRSRESAKLEYIRITKHYCNILRTILK